MNIALKKPLRLIVIEDAEPDAILLVRDLQQHGYEVHYRQVKSARALEQALESGTWDLIISDFSLPGFSGLKALEMVKQRRIDVPFLMMSGIITEEMAVEALNAGANDFFQKGKFARLIPAIERELREAEKRRSHREVERQLHSSEERFIKSFQSNPLAIMICTLQDEIFVDVNPRFLDLLRYSREAVIGRTVDEVHLWFSDDDHSRMRQYLTKHSQVQDLEMQCCTSDGERKDVLVSIESIDLNGEPCTLAMIVDITERKRIERAEREQRVLAEALRDTALALSSTLELSEVLDLILENLVKVITYDAANIILSQADTVRIVRSSGYVFSSLVNQPLSPDNFPALKTILETRRPLLIPDTRIYPDWYSIFPNITVLSYIGVPILARDQILGVLNLYSFSPSFFNEQHLARLDVFGTQAAIAIQNAQLYQRAHELAARCCLPPASSPRRCRGWRNVRRKKYGLNWSKSND
jgi:PAS domain S-box-containing protein